MCSSTRPFYPRSGQDSTTLGVRDHGWMTTDPSATTVELPDWGIEPPLSGLGVVWLTALAEVLLAVLGALAASRVLSGEWNVWLAAPVALAAGVVFWLRLLRTGRNALRSAGARALTSTEAPRLTNIAEGLAADLGAPIPELWWVDGAGANALVAWSRGGHVGVTKALVEGCTRTETEAALAACLVRLASGEARRSTFLLGSGVARPAQVGASLDTLTVAVTRYPPGLVRLLEKCEPATGRFASLWLVGTETTHEPAGQRIVALNDL